MKRILWQIMAFALFGVVLLGLSPQAQDAVMGGFTPNASVTIAFPKSTYPMGAKATAEISIAGSPDGEYDVFVTGDDGQKFKPLKLEIGGAPGSNTGTLDVVLPNTKGPVTYTASVTIGNETPIGKAKLNIQADKNWEKGQEISVGRLIEPANENMGPFYGPYYIEEGSSIVLEVEEAEDKDYWKVTSSGAEGTEADELTYSWNDDPAVTITKLEKDNRRITYKGNVLDAGVGSRQAFLTCTIDDKPKEIPATEGGERGDADKKISIEIHVVRRMWDAGTPIGQGRDAEGNSFNDGRLLAPIDYSDPDAVDGDYYTAAGAQIGFEIESASDWDRWSKYDAITPIVDWEADTITDEDYQWSVQGPGGGSFDKLLEDEVTRSEPASTLKGRKVRFLVPAGASAGDKFIIKCEVSNAHGKAIVAPDGGTRVDGSLVRTQTVTIPASSVKLALYQKYVDPNTGNVSYDSKSESAGGTLYGALEVKALEGSKVASSSAHVRFEETEKVNGKAHGEADSHVDVEVKFNEATGWQKQLDSGAWADSPEAPTSAPAEGGHYRYLMAWDTTHLQTKGRLNKNGELVPGILRGHNGAHALSLVAVNGKAGNKVVFTSANGGEIEAQAPQKVAIEIANLVIEDVSTSNGTSDYFKFKAGSDNESLRSPKIYFTIEDEGDPHIYRWRVRVRGTNIEDIYDSIVYEGLAGASEEVEVTINQSPVAAEFPAETKIKQSGAYNFEISVREYKSQAEADAAIAATREQTVLQQGNYIDIANLRSEFLSIPHWMPMPNETKLGHDGWMDFTNELRPVWHLSHYFSDPVVGGDIPVKEVQVDLLPPDLSDPLAQVPLPSNHNTPYLDRVFYTFEEGEWRNNAVWIAITTAKDDHADSYRDHKNRSMLAKNDRVDRTTNPEVVSVTPSEASKVLISALYGGGYPTPEQAVLAQAPATNEDAFAKVRITAMVKNAIAGDVVTFEVTDPDDASPYAEDTTPESIYDFTNGALNGKLDIAAASDNGQPNNGNDNRDPSKNGRSYSDFQEQGLGLRQITIGSESSEKLQDGTWKVWTTLNITDRFGGDNYVVNATTKGALLEQSFSEQDELQGKFKSSGLLVAWKRVYSDFNRSYAMGSDLTAAFPLSSDPNQDVEQKAKVDEVLADGEDYDVLFVRSAEDFTVGDTLILWNRDEPTVEVNLVRKDEVRKALVVSRPTLGEIQLLGGVTAAQTFPLHSGVRIKGKEELAGDVSREGLPTTYGQAADGSDGGAFVEFKETGGWIIPNAKKLSSIPEGISFISGWNKTPIRINQFHMSFVAVDPFALHFAGFASPDQDGVRDQSGEGMGLTAVAYMEDAGSLGYKYPTQSKSGEKFALAHEFGHLLGRMGDGDPQKGNHIDRKSSLNDADAIDHEGTHLCVMCYETPETFEITHFEFGVDCIYGIRDKERY